MTALHRINADRVSRKNKLRIVFMFAHIEPIFEPLVPYIWFQHGLNEVRSTKTHAYIQSQPSIRINFKALAKPKHCFHYYYYKTVAFYRQNMCSNFQRKKEVETAKSWNQFNRCSIIIPMLRIQNPDDERKKMWKKRDVDEKWEGKRRMNTKSRFSSEK